MNVESGIRIMDYYKDYNVREICKEVKNCNKRCEELIADFLSKNVVVDSNSILIPAPQHYGYADYTFRIAQFISKKTNAKVLNILKCENHESLYSQKINNKKLELRMFLSELFIENNKKIFFIDNVISTGKTFECAKELIKDIKPMVYAKVITNKN